MADPLLPRLELGRDACPKPPLVEVELPGCDGLLNTRPRDVVAPRPLPLAGTCDMLPRPRPRMLWPLTDDIFVTVEVSESRRHVWWYHRRYTLDLRRI